MNFLRNLFKFLIEKRHMITKKMYIVGCVFITTGMVSIFLLGSNGYGSRVHHTSTQDEQAKIAKETEASELEELIDEEEELVSQATYMDMKMSMLRREIYSDHVKTKTSVLNQFKTVEPTDVVESHEEPQIERSEEAAPELLTAPPAKEDSDDSSLQLSELNQLASEKQITVSKRDPVTLTDDDYGVLTRIVEAEVGTEDLLSRTIIANVIINRMYHSTYPNTIREVVFQNNGRVYQFSPILDGRYNKVTISQKTREAVKLAVAGYDPSSGALAFVNRQITSAKAMKWFDTHLTFVMKYGVVEFFKL